MGEYHNGFHHGHAEVTSGPQRDMGGGGSIDQIGSFLAGPHHMIKGLVGVALHRSDYAPTWSAHIYHLESGSLVRFVVSKSFHRTLGNA